MDENRQMLLADILRNAKGMGSAARAIAQPMLGDIPAGLSGLGTMMLTGDADKAAENTRAVQEQFAYEPNERGGEYLGALGRGASAVYGKAKQLDPKLEGNIAALRGDWERFSNAAPGVAAITAGVVGAGIPEGRAEAATARAAEKAAAKAAAQAERAAAKQAAKDAAAAAEAAKPQITKAEIKALAEARGEPDVYTSFAADDRLKGGGTIPREEVEQGLANRARYRQEPQTLPKKPEEMSDQDWVDFGNQYGADLSQTPMRSLGVSDIATRRELMVPGGTEGEFTIPDLFRIKADNFDPTILGQDVHNKLMQKFLRTHTKGRVGDDVDLFNDLSFAQLSPNAPLTQNEFLQQRLRVRSPDELEALAGREGTPNLREVIDKESGVGAAARGGFGVAGTADFGSQATLARLLREKPEMFRPGEGETIRDVGYRIMNQVPGLGVKTSSLGVPWTDLYRANTSAVDLHMIRNNYKRLAAEDPEFAARLKTFTDKGVDEEEAAIKLIGGQHPSAVYRQGKGPNKGELSEGVPSYLAPEKLAHEPKQFITPNKWYTRVMDYVDESRGANPELELFPEQWRLWDTYRARVEPHEMAHPDWRKLPKQSFTELQNALRAHRELGYMDAPDEDTMRNLPVRTGGDWRKLYYGKADPTLLAATAAGGGAAAAAPAFMNRDEKKRNARIDALRSK